MAIKKYSRKREAILDVINASKAHPTAESVYAALKPKYPDLSLGTVYRNIALFKQEGEVMSVGVVNGQERLDGNTMSHPHFICDKCGRVYDVDGLEEGCGLDAMAEKAMDCRVSRHNLVFYGVCGKCGSEADAR